jgi:hypothetical protein
LDVASLLLVSCHQSLFSIKSQSIDAANHSLTILRPGFGGSTPVALHDRLSNFVEAIPLLLTHLQIKHIALACQSAGTIYAFNLLTHHPELLYPTLPSITFFSPWVHQSHSSVSFLTLASRLPTTLLNHWNKIMSFVVNTVQPTFAVSGGAFTLATSAFKDKVAAKKQKEEEASKCLNGYGWPLDVKEEVDKAVFKYGFAENSIGANDEARLCLKSVSGVSWDACDDYEKCVKDLAEAWDKRVSEGGKPLRVDIFLPEEDMMVGNKGMTYFENCWKEENCGKGMKVQCVRLKGTDHETTTNASNEGIGKMISVVKGLPSVE